MDTDNNESSQVPFVIGGWKERSETVGKLAAALSKTQATIEAAKKDSSNPFFKSKYADLSSVWTAIRGPLTANELSILQEPSAEQGRVYITTTLMHSSGEYVRSTLMVPVAKADAQGYGSAITYGRRYALQSVVGIAPEDDDGNAATGTKQPIAPKQQTPPNTFASAYWYDAALAKEGKSIEAADYLKKNGAKWDDESGLFYSENEIPKTGQLRCDAPPL